jgi:hypothetical protein
MQECYSRPTQNCLKSPTKEHAQANFLTKVEDSKYDYILQDLIFEAFVVFVPLSSSKDNNWYFNTGRATNHLTHRKD